MGKVIWIGNPPEQCDLCGAGLEDVFYDAKTHGGPWGFLCVRCFKAHGIGLGMGRGQKYRRNGSRYEKVAG
jgi:hypothetical protein